MFPFWDKMTKKFSAVLDCLLLMQLPRRNVDFSNLGLIGRHREEKVRSARVGSRNQASLGFACLHFQDCDLLASRQGYRSHTTL